VSPLLTVILLGPFAVENANGPLPALPKKAQALLAFLVLNRGRPIPRDELAALLWSNTGSEQARQSLRQGLSALRRTLHPSMADNLVTKSDTLILAPSAPLVSDVEALERFDRSATKDDLIQAEALFRGEFLAGLNIPGEPFEDWVEAERQRLLSARLRILTDLAGLHAKAGDFNSAIEIARRLTGLDPFREESSRLLMTLLAASGQRGLALVEHARVERMLCEELELTPDSTTRQLAEKIKRGDFVQLYPPNAPVMVGVDTSGRHVPSTPRGDFTRPDRAVVTVQAFRDISDESAKDHFAEALTEEVVAALVREKWPIVVVSPSYPMHAADPKARYVVGGSIRRAGRRVRVLVGLVDTASNQYLWSEQVEAEGDAIFVLLDELCARIVARLAPAIRAAEIGHVERKPADELTAYELYLRAAAVCRRGLEGNTLALRLLRRAIDVDPELAVAPALAAHCFHLKRLMGWAAPDDRELYNGVRLAHRAVELSDSDPEALWMSGLAMAIIDGNARDGRNLLDRSLAINPHNATAWISSSFARAHSGDPATALDHFRQAQAVNPDDGSQHLQWHAAAMAYFVGGRYEEADDATARALARIPNYPGSLRLKIAIEGLAGRIDTAREAARCLLETNPNASIASMRSYWQPLVRHTSDAVGALIHGWRRAGMPDG
jgi:DNA-binding SARP family transcriptional activator/TolB-like protein